MQCCDRLTVILVLVFNLEALLVHIICVLHWYT